jgi:acyl carrier protein
MDSIKNTIREYIRAEFLYGDTATGFNDSTPLISGGVLDSLTTLKLVQFLESQFHIQLDAHEMTVDFLDTVNDIATLIAAKQ